MSRGLFQRKHKPFEEENHLKKNDEEEEEEVLFMDFGGKKKIGSKKKAIGIDRKRPTSEIEESIRKKPAVEDSIVLIDSDNEEHAKKSNSKNDIFTNLFDSITTDSTISLDDTDDQVTQQATNILKRIATVQKTSVAAASTSAPLKETTITTDTSTYYIPKVLTAAERQKLAQEYKLPTKGKGQGKQMVDMDEFEEEDTAATLKIKTRLQGSDEMNWVLNPSSSFTKLKQNLSKRYNVPITQIGLSFDGESIEEDDTPQSLDLEEGYLIDVKMDRKLLAKALEHASSKKK